MRLIILGLALSGLVAGCSYEVPNDGDQYYNNMADSPILSEEEQRLADVENNPETVVLPEEQATAEAAVTGEKTAEESANISDSQNFETVSAAESIESDKAKIDARKDTYQIFAPTTAPIRKDGINLAAYALAQTNAVGEKAYSRFGTGKANCNKYRKNPDEAQRAFIRAGGPAKDPRNLDSDGDGFACGWNPDFYRSLMQSG